MSNYSLPHSQIVASIVATPAVAWSSIERRGVHTMRDNPDISLWKIRTDEAFSESWMNQYTDTTGKRLLIELRYRNTPVEEFVFVVVDGGRHIVPLPNKSNTVSPLAHKIGEIINDPQTMPGSYQQALDTAGITVF